LVYKNFLYVHGQSVLTDFYSEHTVGTLPGVNVMISIFSDLCPFSAKKIGVFLKTQYYDPFFQKQAVV
jgi:hypothetical protein